jgi:hypothetical protein
MFDFLRRRYEYKERRASDWRHREGHRVSAAKAKMRDMARTMSVFF